MHACTHTLTDEGQGKSNQGRAACAREHTTAVLGSAGQGAGNWVQITGAAEACACAVVGGARLIDWLSVGSCVLGGNCTRVGALPRECPTRTAHSRACTRMHSLSLPLPPVNLSGVTRARVDLAMGLKGANEVSKALVSSAVAHRKFLHASRDKSTGR